MSEQKISARLRAKQVCQEILMEGQLPRFQEVKDRIEGGSPNDIKRGIDEWSEEHIDFVHSQMGRPGVPGWLFESVKDIYDAAIEHVEKQFASRRLELEREREQSITEVEAARSALAQAQEQAEKLECRLADMETLQKQTQEKHYQEVSDLQEQLTKAHSEIETLKRDCALSEAELKSAETRMDALKIEFKEQMAKESERNQAEESRLINQVDQERTERREAQNELSTLRESLRLRVEEDNKRIAALNLELNQRQIELAGKDRQCGELQTHISELGSKLSRSDEALTELRTRLDECQSKESGDAREIAMLRDARNELQNQVATLLDRVAKQTDKQE